MTTKANISAGPGPSPVFRQDLQQLKIWELRQLVTENEDALRRIEGKPGARYDTFRRHYSARLDALRAKEGDVGDLAALNFLRSAAQVAHDAKLREVN